MAHRLNGTYEGFRPFEVKPGTDDIVARQLATVTLKVKPDGTADLSDGGVPVEGRIDYGVNDATFVPEAIVNVSVAKQPKGLVEKFTVPLKRIDDDHWLYGGQLKLTRRKEGS